MNERKSPQAKKQAEYDRDHRVADNESRHAFRKKWPKKKAKVRRRDRAKLRAVLTADPADATAGVLKSALRRGTNVKRGVVSLRDWVQKPHVGRHRSIKPRNPVE